MGYLSSGNQTVDAMGSLNITGNVIPTIWYKTILKENGKPYLLAIAILADIVYWYRPAEVRSQSTGQILGWKKKFSGDILRQSYQYYADLFGESKKTVKAAIDRLEELRVVRREFRTIFHGEGLVSNNVMYLALMPEQLYRLTYPETEPDYGRREKPCPAGTGTGMGGGLPAEPDVPEIRMGRSPAAEADTGICDMERHVSFTADMLVEEIGGSLPPETDTPMERMVGSLLPKTEIPVEETGGSLPPKADIPVEETGGSLPPKTEIPVEEMGGRLPPKTEIPMEEMGGRGIPKGIQVPPGRDTGGDENVYPLSPRREGVPSQNGGTYTENTSKISCGDSMPSINPSIRGTGDGRPMDGMEDAAACMNLIRQNIEYDHHMKYDRYDEKVLYEELYAVICEVVCVKRRSVRVGGEDYPYELVRARFLTLNESHLQYVMECMRNTSTKITNIKSYMVTALYNAPMTKNHYYQQEVNHDMHGGWREAGMEC